MQFQLQPLNINFRAKNPWAAGENGRGNPSLLGNGLPFENSRFLRDTMPSYTTNCSRWLIAELVLFV